MPAATSPTKPNTPTTAPTHGREPDFFRRTVAGWSTAGPGDRATVVVELDAVVETVVVDRRDVVVDRTDVVVDDGLDVVVDAGAAVVVVVDVGADVVVGAGLDVVVDDAAVVVVTWAPAGTAAHTLKAMAMVRSSRNRRPWAAVTPARRRPPRPPSGPHADGTDRAAKESSPSLHSTACADGSTGAHRSCSARLRRPGARRPLAKRL